jgi:hypothetical protein
MFVKHQVVGSAVQLLIGKAASLLVLDFEDGVSDGLPVLAGLVACHVAVSHFLTVHLKLNR